MYLIENNQIGKIKNFRHNGLFYNREKNLYVYNFKVEQSIDFVDNLNISFISIKSKEKNENKMIVKMMFKLKDTFKDENLDKIKMDLFNHFSQKQYSDFFFNVPISMEVDDEESREKQFNRNVSIRFIGFSKFNPKLEHAYSRALDKHPDFNKLRNKRTKDFIEEKLDLFFDEMFNPELSQFIEIAKIFDINSDEYSDAIRLNYAT